MKRLMAAWVIMGMALASPALGDRVVLNDGRTFEGSVTRSGEKILIEMPYGIISIPAADVQSIQRGPSPVEQFEFRQARIDGTDPDELTALARWARGKGMPRRAEECLQAALALDADHGGARRLLGYVRVDGKWLTAAGALRLAQAKLDAGQTDVLLERLLGEIEQVVDGDRDRFRLKEVQAHALLRARQFAEARACFEWLAGKSAPPESIRHAAVADVLKTHPDGMYVLAEPHPPLAMLLDVPTEAPFGPASLSRPEVLAAAVRDQAKDAVKAGKVLVDEGKKLEFTEPEAAKAKYDHAARSFDRADALVASIARSYRIEIARRRIAMITKDMNIWAGRFDTLKGELAKRDLAPAAYASLVVRMLRALNNVRDDLDAILGLASPFQRDLVLEITDAAMRRQRVDALRKVLAEELQQLNANR